MNNHFWRGEFIVLERSDETADIYSWDAATGSYRWHSDWDTPEQAHRYIEEVEALRPFPQICPISTIVLPVAPRLDAAHRNAPPRNTPRHTATLILERKP